jgi:glutamine amidotransferase
MGGIQYTTKSDLFKDIAENEYMYLVHSFMLHCAESIATITN